MLEKAGVALSIRVANASVAECEALMDHWSEHDQPPDVVWSPVDVRLAAWDGETVVGAAVGTIVGGVGELKQLLVRKAHARAGAGSQLLQSFEAHCRQAGCHKLRLETAEYQARPFYEQHRFTVVATLPQDRFGYTWFVMAKAI